MDKSNILQELVRMSSNLGCAEMGCVILDEGCTSAGIDDDHFYTKARGALLSKSSSESFVQVRMSEFVGLPDNSESSQEEIYRCLDKSRVDKNGLYPTMDAVLHAYLLTLPGVRFIGHTHPSAVNEILCSNTALDMLGHRILPLEALYCGTKPVFAPESASANAIRRELDAFIEKERALPKAILLQNHGLVALGSDAAEVESITAMWVKIARILAGAYVLGGIHSLATTII